ncbi:MAG: acetyl-CoA carboxylase biotin carboxyl carrier protein [Candidatus Tokpelaia sp. JSC085]|nr:MAG: acetyl-CoA carboxylase biotin carboxyl carrier protein [Candidatus Tokpelaia sp. JSC085]
MAAKDASEKTDIDTKFIRTLAKILNETNLSDIEVENSNLRIHVSRAVTRIPPVQAVYTPQSVSHQSIADAVSAVAAVEDPENAVTSPMVGTAYLAPSPGAPPFVMIGDKVDEGQTLLIVEAMKTMNQIPSPRSGIVRQILVQDAQPVEFGEPLVILQ